MELKDILGPAVSIIAIVVTVWIYSNNNKRERKREFAELRGSMDKDHQTEIEKLRKDAEKSLEYQKHFDEQKHEIATLRSDIRNQKETHEELRSDLHEIKDTLIQVLQKVALFEQSIRQKSKEMKE